MSESTIRTEADAVIEQTLLGLEPVELTPGRIYALRTRESSIWFYNSGQRGLSRRDPNQREQELGVIPMRPRHGTVIATDRSDSDKASA
jgi:hypothetical protein